LCIVSVVLFFVAARYRLPYQVGLSVAAGGGASWLIDRIRAKLFRELVPALVAAGAALAVVVWPTGLSDGRAEEQVKMGLFEIDRGNITEGEAWISHAVDPSLPVNARHPFPGVVHLRAGQAHEDHKRFDAALEHYRQAARIDPDQPSLFVASARMLTQLGRPDEAVAELDRIPSNVSGDSIAAEYERAGTALVLTRRYDSILKAIDILEKAETRAPKAPSIRLNRAVALVMAGRTAEARDEAQAALDLDPGYAKAAEFLASLKKVPGF
jgi:tetratricopeptide (TPR) repeat protein